MKKVIMVLCLSLLPLIASAEEKSTVAPAPTTAPPPATAEAAASADSGHVWRTVATTLGVVGGVIAADLLVGGTLTASLVGWGPTVAAAPVVYSPAVLAARAAGAVLGEMIAPATAIRDAAARADMLYALLLGVGGVAGATIIYWLTGSSSPEAPVNQSASPSSAAGG